MREVALFRPEDFSLAIRACCTNPLTVKAWCAPRTTSVDLQVGSIVLKGIHWHRISGCWVVLIIYWVGAKVVLTGQKEKGWSIYARSWKKSSLPRWRNDAYYNTTLYACWNYIRMEGLRGCLYSRSCSPIICECWLTAASLQFPLPLFWGVAPKLTYTTGYRRSCKMAQFVWEWWVVGGCSLTDLEPLFSVK